jgi:hypothetical protein
MDVDRINPFAAHGLRIYRYIIEAGAELDAVRALEEGHGDDKVLSAALLRCINEASTQAMEYFANLMCHDLADAVKDYRDEWRKGKDLAELRGVKPTLPGLPYYGEILQDDTGPATNRTTLAGMECPPPLHLLVRVAMAGAQLAATLDVLDQSSTDLGAADVKRLKKGVEKIQQATREMWSIAERHLITWCDASLVA